MRIVELAAIQAAVDRPAALRAAERAFRALDAGDVVQPVPLGMDLPEAAGEVHVKGAWIRAAPIFALKVATGFYGNAARGLPTGSGMVLVLDAGTGFPLAVLRDDGWLTELRTAAAGALAARLLTPPVPLQVAVLGSGTQARFQMRAIADVRAIERVTAWSPTRAHLERYCREMAAELGVPCEPAASAEQAVRAARLVVTVTPSRAPILGAESVRPDATVLAIGSDGPDKRELAPELLARAGRVVTDSTAQCARLGELHHAIEQGVFAAARVHAELGAIVAGRAAGRARDELIVCDLTGVGALDAALAEVVWRAL